MKNFPFISVVGGLFQTVIFAFVIAVNVAVPPVSTGHAIFTGFLLTVLGGLALHSWFVSVPQEYRRNAHFDEMMAGMDEQFDSIMETVEKMRAAHEEFIARKDTDEQTIKNMETYGGSFVKALAPAFRHADDSNYAKLKGSFSEYWTQYETFEKPAPAPRKSRAKKPVDAVQAPSEA